MMQVVSFSAADPRIEQAWLIRQLVFCDEQGVSAAEEWDGLDEACEHYLLMDGDNAMGTARTRILPGGTAKIERVAILKQHRGGGSGRALMDFIMARLKEADPPAIALNAQCSVEKFYAKLGFVAHGDIFDDAGIPHIHMIWRSA